VRQIVPNTDNPPMFSNAYRFTARCGRINGKSFKARFVRRGMEFAAFTTRSLSKASTV